MLAERLKTLRQKANLTQEEIAKKIGVSRPAYSYLEKGVKTPTPDKLTKIAKFYGVTTDYLLGNESEDDEFANVEMLFRMTSDGLTEEEKAVFREELVEFMKERKKAFDEDKK